MRLRIFLTICFFVFSVNAQNSLKIAPTAAPPKIDGVLEAAEWKRAAKVGLVFQVYPGDKLPAAEQTEAFIQYDKEFFYVAFHAFDSEPGGHSRARLETRFDRRRRLLHDFSRHLPRPAQMV